MLRRQDFLPGACRPVIKSYDWEAQNLEVASRALKLIDEMVLARTQGLAGTVNCHGGAERGGD